MNPRLSLSNERTSKDKAKISRVLEYIMPNLDLKVYYLKLLWYKPVTF